MHFLLEAWRAGSRIQSDLCLRNIVGEHVIAVREEARGRKTSSVTASIAQQHGHSVSALQVDANTGNVSRNI